VPCLVDGRALGPLEISPQEEVATHTNPLAVNAVTVDPEWEWQTEGYYVTHFASSGVWEAETGSHRLKPFVAVHTSFLPLVLHSFSPPTPEQRCLQSGGTVATAQCCKSVGDFPNLCASGACGCAPWYSHEVRVCNCGSGRCFDGRACVQQEREGALMRHRR
jgi:hypothetical protein